MSARDAFPSVVAVASSSFSAQRSAIRAGDKRATTDACNSLLNYLADSADLPTLVRTALNGDAVITGLAFTDILLAVMQADADQAAERELADAARLARDDPANCQAKTRAQVAALEKLQI
ncbi:hypothetical protein ACQ4WP_26815 [Janthinobacterium sp. GB4P2]|uniref:hypothetical protein n=1 Tax=Janthinobacterium sp. GB4P2 TaxID=3424189 RepID=UPI003F234726